MQNLNSYNQELFKIKFEQTETFLTLTKKYDIILFDKFFELVSLSTPRQHHGTRIVSAVPFYYLDYLDSSMQIVDLGCGWNFFKPYFPSLHGVGAENTSNKFFGDENDYIDDDYYTGHVNTFDSLFSICALHYHPLENLREICIKFSNMLKPGGRGFLSLNAQRMLERSTQFTNNSKDEIDHWIRHQFVNFPTKILVFDVDLSLLDAWMDGNIRIVFEK